MKKVIFFAVIAMFCFTACEKENNTKQPQNNEETNSKTELILELPKMYLEGNLISGQHMVVQSQEELLSIFMQETINQSSDLQEIEFETQTLLIGREDYNYAANLNYEFSSTEENQYLFTVNITGGYTMMDYGFWYGIIVSKLPANSEIVFNINKQNNNSDNVIPTTPFTLAGCGLTNNVITDTVYIINSNEELANYINCENDFPQIDFSQQTLLVVFGYSTNGIIDITAELSKTGTEYSLTVDIVQDLTAHAPKWHFILLTEKLTTNHIELLVNAHF